MLGTQLWAAALRLQKDSGYVLALAVLVALGLALVEPAAAQTWLKAEASASLSEGREHAEASARNDALARALAQFLQEWLAPAEIEHHTNLLQRWFFRRPGEYVSATSDVTVYERGSRLDWVGLVQFDRDRVTARLSEVGLITPFDRLPLFVAEVEPAAAREAVAAAPWVKAFAAAGIRLVFPTANTPAPTVHDGTWSVRVVTQTVTDPYRPNAALTLTTTTLAGTVAGQPFAWTFVAPAALAPPEPLATQLAIDAVLALWAPSRAEAMEQARWTAGTFYFPSAAAWRDFDRRITTERDVFHNVYPHRIRRTASGWEVEYAFFLNEGADANAQSWLMNQDLIVTRPQPRRFEVTPRP